MSLSLPREASTEPIIAWRAWTCTPDGVLRSLVYPRPWPAHTAVAMDPLAVRAVCMRGHTSHHPPHRTCGCGWYGVKTVAQVLTWVRFRQSMDKLPPVRRIVIGRVALWGRVIEHEAGYRAEFAYEACLYVGTSPLLPLLSERYRVEVYPLHFLRSVLNTGQET